MPTRKKKAAAKKPAAKRATRKTGKAKRTSSKAKRSSSRMVTQVKQTAMKVLAGATSGAVQAMLPPLEKVMGKIADASGAKKQGATKRSKSRA